MDDEGVSPVIGTILMVAIVAVLAVAIIAVLNSQVPPKSEDAPKLIGIRDERHDQWTVASGGFEPADRYDIRGSDVGIRYEINGPATAASDLLPQIWTPLADPPPLQAGTTYSFCREAGSGSFDFQIRHRATNSLIVDIMFAELLACA